MKQPSSAGLHGLAALRRPGPGRRALTALLAISALALPLATAAPAEAGRADSARSPIQARPLPTAQATPAARRESSPDAIAGVTGPGGADQGGADPEEAPARTIPVGPPVDWAPPPELSGFWALGGCGATSTEMWAIQAGLELSAAETAFATPFRPVGPRAHDWIAVDPRDGPLFFVRLADKGAALDYAELADDPGGSVQGLALQASGPGETPDGEVWSMARYQRCPAAPAPFAMTHGEATAVLAALDPAAKLCRASAPGCAAGLFRALDVTGDGGLTQAEIARALRVAAHIARLLDISSGEADAAELSGIFALSLPVAPLAAKALLASFDYDGDARLSLAELAADRGLPGVESLAGASPRLDSLLRELHAHREDLLPLLLGLGLGLRPPEEAPSQDPNALDP